MSEGVVGRIAGSLGGKDRDGYGCLGRGTGLTGVAFQSYMRISLYGAIVSNPNDGPSWLSVNFRPHLTRSISENTLRGANK